MASSLAKLLLAVLSALLMAGALCSALLILSSSSLAFAECGGQYSLFAESARCRQPHVAAVLTAVLFAVSIASMYASGRVGKALPGSNERT